MNPEPTELLRGTRVRNDRFDPRDGLLRGRPAIIEMLWYLVKMVFFLTAFPWPSRLKSVLLSLFGAHVGVGLKMKPRVNIHLPWKLEIGDHVWIGEEAWILNFEPVAIGSHACISQRAFLCTGNHDYRAPNMRFRNAAITVSAGAWIGAAAFIAPGVTIGVDSVVTAGSTVLDDLPAAMICSGQPCRPVRPRWIDS